jgi:hypothetical protein
VHVSRRLLDDEDGPMLEVLKGFHGVTIEPPSKKLWQPGSRTLGDPVRTLPEHGVMAREEYNR